MKECNVDSITEVCREWRNRRRSQPEYRNSWRRL
jgi:hypothetical protein